MAVAFFMKGMLVDYIPDNCIKTPDDADGEYDRNEYPHFEVFCALHLGTGMEYDVIEHNARIIGSVPEEQIREMTREQFKAIGCTIYSADSWD